MKAALEKCMDDVRKMEHRIERAKNVMNEAMLEYGKIENDLREVHTSIAQALDSLPEDDPPAPASEPNAPPHMHAAESPARELGEPSDRAPRVLDPLKLANKLISSIKVPARAAVIPPAAESMDVDAPDLLAPLAPKLRDQAGPSTTQSNVGDGSNPILLLDGPDLSASTVQPGANRPPSTSLVDFKLNLQQVLDMFGRTDVGSAMTPGDGNCFFTGAAQYELLLEIVEREKREPTEADIRGIERDAMNLGSQHREAMSTKIKNTYWIEQYINMYWPEMTSLTTTPPLKEKTRNKAKLVADLLGQHGKWANELAIRALALALGKDIFIVGVTGDNVVNCVYHYSSIIKDEELVSPPYSYVTLYRSMYLSKKPGFDVPTSLCDFHSIVLVHSDSQKHFWATYPLESLQDRLTQFALISEYTSNDCFVGVSMDKLKELFQWNN
jgi:hypothetical protein